MPLSGPTLSARERWLLARVVSGRILDIGFAGQKGELPAYYACLNQGNARVFGVDFNTAAVLRRRHIRSSVADASRLPFTRASMDGIILGEFLEHQTDVTPFFRECGRVLKPGGQLLITTPNPGFINRVVKHWILPRSGSHVMPDNVALAMGYEDHAILWDPLSLCRLLQRSEFDVVGLTTLGLWVPLLGRLFTRFRRGLMLDLWPFNRVGYITCVEARRR
jgi:SAM-dependent methyltransferase